MGSGSFWDTLACAAGSLGAVGVGGWAGEGSRQGRRPRPDGCRLVGWAAGR